MRRKRTETLDSTYDRGLTARPAVLAKRTEPGRHASRPKGWRSGPAFFEVASALSLPGFSSNGFRLISDQAMPAAFARLG